MEKWSDECDVEAQAGAREAVRREKEMEQRLKPNLSQQQREGRKKKNKESKINENFKSQHEGLLNTAAGGVLRNPTVTLTELQADGKAFAKTLPGLASGVANNAAAFVASKGLRMRPKPVK